MDQLKDFFKIKKNLINVLVLGILVLALPLGIGLIRQQQIFLSRAGGGPPIKFVGPNVEERAGKTIALKPQVALELISPLGPPAGTTRTAKSESLQMSLLPQELVSKVKAQEYLGCLQDPSICTNRGQTCDWYNPNSDADGCISTGGGGGGEYLGCYDGSYTCPPGTICDWFNPNSDANGCIATGGGGIPPPTCYDQFLYNQCVGCNLSEGVYQNSCTGAYSSDPPAPDYTGQCSGSQYCGSEPSPPPDGGPKYCDSYNQVCWDDQGNQGTQFCYGGSIQQDTGACGYDPQFTSRCDLCQVNIGPQPGQCPAKATACWRGAGCSDQQGADSVCAQNNGAGSKCSQTEGQANTKDDGCTIPTPTGQCSLSASPTNIQTGQSITWTIKANPVGTEATWGGTSNSQAISQPVLGYPNRADGWAETYTYKEGGSHTRNANIKYSDGNVCQTNTVSVTVTGSAIDGAIPSVTGTTIPPSSQQKPYPTGSKQTATVNFKDAGHVDTYYIGPLAGTGGSTTSSSSQACTLGEPCVRQCELLFSAQALVAKDDKTGKPLLDDGCWQEDFNGYAFKLRDNTWSRDPLSQCKPWTCTNFDPKIHFDPKSDPRYSSYFNVQGVSTGQVLQASTTTGTSTRVKTLSSGESGKQFDWIAPTQPGKYNFVANAHKITFDKSNNHNSDWDPNVGDKGCAWDGFVYLPGTPLQKTNEACTNSGPKEFWVGTGTQSPGPVPPGPVRSPSPGPGRSPSPGPGGRSPSPGPAGPTTRAYKIAEDPASLSNAPEKPYTQEPTVINWEFTDKTPGKKFIWVEFIASDGKTKRESASIDLLGPDPTITSCSLDITGQNVTFVIRGSNFGTDKGTVKSDSQSLTPSLWKETEIRALWVNPPTGEAFPVIVTRPNGQKVDGQCSSIAQIFFSGNLFCPQVNKAQEFKGELVVKEATPGATPRREKITLRGGIIKDLETRLQEGITYQIGLKVERGLRKLFGLTAQKGTTNINGVILPLGDICPAAAADGKINSIDKACLNQQWGPIKGTKNCDLNSDQVCNSFEWACMRQFFNQSDEEEPK